jgi:hypothetical protein
VIAAGAPIFPGRDETQLDVVFSYTGTPTERNWPGVEKLENYSMFVKGKPYKPPQLVKRLKEKFPAMN